MPPSVEGPSDLILAPDPWDRWGRAFGFGFVALTGLFLSLPYRVFVWTLLALLVRWGFFAELVPVRLRQGRLYRGLCWRELEEAVDLRGVVVAGLWPRFGVRFADGATWWLPLGRGWTLVWDAIRQRSTGLPDWRSTPLFLFFLARARDAAPPAALPGELVDCAERLGLGTSRPGFFLSLAVTGVALRIGGWLSPAVIHGAADELGFWLALGTAVEALAGVYALHRLRALQEGCRGDSGLE